MEGIKPCPYCNGAVELVKLNKKKGEKQDKFRVECRKCRKLVERGRGFPCESKEAANERIEQYERIMRYKLGLK